MNPASDECNPVEVLAEEFLDRKRRGEQPTPEEYVQRYPDLAERIQTLFPALLMLADLGESSGTTTGALAAGSAAVAGVALQRLGDYRILREIGRGGMGIVYEAEQESLGRRVALKVLSNSVLLDHNRVLRFEREARAAARLHHTNIVPVFGVGRQDGHHYFVMQFIAGLGLDRVLDHLRRLRQSETGADAAPASSEHAGLPALDVARSLITGRFAAIQPADEGSETGPVSNVDRESLPTTPAGSPGAGSSSALLPGASEPSAPSDPDRQFHRSVARIGIQVADALEYANRQGTLHRDIKPSNLLLDNHGNVWVADFGLAKTADDDDLTLTGDILGTIRYMAPERFQGKCDARSDVYSLGLTLYELIALRPAYEAADRHLLMERVLNEEPESLRKLAPGVPRDLETIVAKAASRDPSLRYVTAGALADDLRRFVEDRPIQARQISPAERLARWCKRNKLLSSSLGIAAAALLAVAVLSLVYARRQARHAAELAEAQEYAAGLAQSYKERLAESQSRLARLDLERGRAACEKGEIGVGMLWTLESLRIASEADDQALRRVALANLTAWKQRHAEARDVFTHDGWVSCAVFSPDGKTIATASQDKTARLWDVATGQPIGAIMRHDDQVVRVTFSPDGRLIATASVDKTVRFWDARSGQPSGPVVQHAAAVYSVAFHPKGRMVATGCSDGGVRLWDSGTGRQIGSPMGGIAPVFLVVFSPDGKTIASGGLDNTVRFWEVANGRQTGSPLLHSGYVYALAVSPDGKFIASGGADKTLRIWDFATGRPLGQPIIHSGPVLSVAFSPDGKNVLTGSDTAAQAWDVATGKPIGAAFEHRARVDSVMFSPDGQSILTGCDDFTARVWDGKLAQPVGRVIEYGSTIITAAFSPDGNEVYSSDVEGRIRRWDISSGRFLGQPAEMDSWSYFMVLSPDGKTILTGGVNNRARIWDLATGRPVGAALEHADRIWAVDFSPDGKVVATGSNDKTARLWDAATGQSLGAPLESSSSISCVTFSPDGITLLVGCRDGNAWFCDVASRRVKLAFREPSGGIACAAYAFNGETIVAGGVDNRARLWNSRTGDPVGAPMQHSNIVVSVAFSPDSRTVIAGSADRKAQLWDVATGLPIGPLVLDISPKSRAFFFPVKFSPDGRYLLFCDQGAVRVFNVPAPLPDDLSRLAAWVESSTGIRLDNRGAIHVLDRAEWLERRRLLHELGGPPPDDPSPRGDPLVYENDPAARGDRWKELGQWDRARAAYGDAIDQRPHNRSAWRALARLHLEQDRPEQAAATLLEAIRNIPDDTLVWIDLGRCLVEIGDHSAWRKLNADLVERLGSSRSAEIRRDLARVCVLAPEGMVDRELPIRLANLALQEASPASRWSYLITLAAALYRADRFELAIERLDESLRLRDGTDRPERNAYLAMAHARLGHRTEALRWLGRLRNHQPSIDPADFASELQVRFQRREAEAVVLYDPIFPADPFAP